MPEQLSQAPASSPLRSRAVRITLLVALGVALVLAGSVAAFFVAPHLCQVTEPQRHGLSCDVPLPDDATFVRQLQPSLDDLDAQSGVELQYRLAGVTAGEVQDFYTRRLPASGWKCIEADRPNMMVFAKQEKRWLVVTIHAGEGSVDFTILFETLIKGFRTDSC